VAAQRVMAAAKRKYGRGISAAPRMLRRVLHRTRHIVSHHGRAAQLIDASAHARVTSEMAYQCSNGVMLSISMASAAGCSNMAKASA